MKPENAPPHIRHVDGWRLLSFGMRDYGMMLRYARHGVDDVAVVYFPKRIPADTAAEMAQLRGQLKGLLDRGPPNGHINGETS